MSESKKSKGSSRLHSAPDYESHIQKASKADKQSYKIRQQLQPGQALRPEELSDGVGMSFNPNDPQ